MGNYMKMKTGFSFSVCACLVLLFVACAPKAPVPGGTNAINEKFYKSKDEFLQKLDRLQAGMTEQDVFSTLGRQPRELVRLKRDEIVMALLGADNITFKDGLQDKDLLQSLYGYRLNYKRVKRVHGFSSPIRIRTNEDGFDYNAVLIFREGHLFEKPILTGGVVDATSSKTFFDLLSPSTIFGVAGG